MDALQPWHIVLLLGCIGTVAAIGVALVVAVIKSGRR
ncbi:hypothetical protein ACWT_3822 [Actinoplanes sp. SE50]|nr:hypothetical protein ACPL_3951 [Actinoplanes sp. SE50/110]ATO83237.1 hypothetical protein ACWT_3822 [Actinoplanes sp. SE50]SLM00644.1 hypothetical protein ACSP50_3877 [Actinoplanes sp. SE50/110]